MIKKIASKNIDIVKLNSLNLRKVDTELFLHKNNKKNA